MADYNCVIKLPNGGVVKLFFNNDLSMKQLKQSISQSIPGATEESLIISFSPNFNDNTKIIKAVAWTSFLSIDVVKKLHPMGFINNSSIENNDGTDSFIMKLYVSLK